MPPITKTSVVPYLMLNGNAREVMGFYQRAIGGDLKMRTYGEAVGESCPEAMRDGIMNAALRFGDFVLMASDSGMGEVPPPNPAVHLSLNAPDAELLRIFRALADGGKIEFEVDDAPWGGKFGSLVDRFGYHWMFASSDG